MKTLFASLLIALTLGTSSASFAAANPTPNKELTEPAATAAVSFAQIIDSKLDVVINKVADSNLEIKFTDASGRIIATKTLTSKQTGTRVRFNLAFLSDGVYHVKVSDGQNTEVKRFEIKTTAPAQAFNQHVTFI